jgi:hypothetical protein
MLRHDGRSRNDSASLGILTRTGRPLAIENREEGMTKQEWSESVDPALMLSFLGDQLTDRRYRHFLAACCGRIWHLLADEKFKRAVDLCERRADGLATDEELHATSEVFFRQQMTHAQLAVAYALHGTTESYTLIACSAAHNAAVAAAQYTGPVAQPSPAHLAEAAEQCRLLRELFNPFLQLVVEPAWLSWNGDVVANMIRKIDVDRIMSRVAYPFSTLPILADALEEAGCGNAELLAHLRQPEEHLLGCWAMELLLRAVREADRPHIETFVEDLNAAALKMARKNAHEPTTRLLKIVEEAERNKEETERKKELTRSMIVWTLIVLLLLLSLAAFFGVLAR